MLRFMGNTEIRRSIGDADLESAEIVSAGDVRSGASQGVLDEKP